MQKPKVIVFIPAFNEEEAIAGVIRTIKKRYMGNKKADYIVEIIVVDDGSKDKTSLIARKEGVTKVVVHPYNMGLGAATRSGMQVAYELGADIAVKIDADFQHDPEDIDKVIRPILEDYADAVFGSRFLGGIKYKMPLYRKMGNSFFSFLTRVFTRLRITDGQTGLMAFHKRYLAQFEMMSDYNETQQLIIDAWRKKMRIIEVPVVFYKRTSGKSFISLKYPFKVLPNIVRLFIHSFPLRIFAPVGLFFVGLSILTSYLVLINKINFLGDASIVILFVSGLQFIFFGLIADIASKR